MLVFIHYKTVLWSLKQSALAKHFLIYLRQKPLSPKGFRYGVAEICYLGINPELYAALLLGYLAVAQGYRYGFADSS